MAQGAGEKTEKASPKKRRDVKKKGEVHKSADMCSAVMLFLTFGALKIGYEGFMRSMRGLSSSMLSGDVIVANARTVSISSLGTYYKEILGAVLPIVLPFMLVVVIGGVAVHVVQTGPMFVTEKLKPDFKKYQSSDGIQAHFLLGVAGGDGQIDLKGRHPVLHRVQLPDLRAEGVCEHDVCRRGQGVFPGAVDELFHGDHDRARADRLFRAGRLISVVEV
jgi:hypothetical protein